MLQLYLFYNKVAEIYPLLKGGKEKKNYISKIIMYFYKGFTRKFYLSCVRISGASRKLPTDWKENSAHIITHVRRDKTTHTDDNDIFVPPILDQYYCNTDHIPIYIGIYGNYKWGEINTGGRKFCIGGKEKAIFTVQLPCTKSGKKLRTFMIRKAA